MTSQFTPTQADSEQFQKNPALYLAECETDEKYIKALKSVNQRGRIELIMGTMFAGKSTELLRQISLMEVAGKKVMRVKFSADNRYRNQTLIATHTGQSRDAIAVTHLAELGESWREFDVIGIDEGQFFTDIVGFAEMAANAHKIVIISSLQGTFFRGPWRNITELIPLCEKVQKLSAICKLCKENASFTFRTADKSVRTVIGGADMYMPLCRDCHARETRLMGGVNFEGDPELINVKAENEAQKSKDLAKRVEDLKIDAQPRQIAKDQQNNNAQKSFSTDLEGSSLEDTPE